MNSNRFKEEGNQLFLKRNYKEAIELYTKAIEKSPNFSIYYTNRALCYLKLKQWQNVIDDCKHAIDIDNQSVKGNFYLGQALFELDNYDDSIIYLKRSYELTKISRENYGDEIARIIRYVKRKRWNKLEEKRIKEENDLQIYLQRLMFDDKCKRIDDIKNKLFKMNAFSSKFNAETVYSKDMTNDYNVNDNSIDNVGEKLNGSSSFASVTTSLDQLDNFDLDENSKDLINNIENEYEHKLNELNRLFNENDIKRRKREIPDYLCGKISFELMSDPVITPSGITYDRNDIEQHLQRVGHFDPITRQELTIDQLIPNLSMKEVIESFVAENPWIDGAL